MNGEIVGEMALFSPNGYRNATISVKSDIANLACIPWDNFFKIIDDNNLFDELQTLYHDRISEMKTALLKEYATTSVVIADIHSFSTMTAYIAEHAVNDFIVTFSFFAEQTIKKYDGLFNDQGDGFKSIRTYANE